MTATGKTEIEPVEKSIIVNRDAETAFRFYTRHLDVWWPKESHSLGADRDGVTPACVGMEEGVGGWLYEESADGTRRSWGKIRVWEPGRRLVHSWQFDKPDEQATEVEVVFTDLGNGQTRIDLTHRGWENDPDGEKLRGGYQSGWDPVLAGLEVRCNQFRE
ncbi:SRPBCC domain-containing protein [Hyphobacterium indicum]|uniref:SRPBCC domain-containing protein n=1 Tax=Hyphobacterium indicum TaxID=2162714 RepID=UPI001374C239|nr:SRPBCC domain-containing protein [Hyphobacterium indicum]